MDGKITSEVKGTGEETAATAKELKATKTVIFILLMLQLFTLFILFLSIEERTKNITFMIMP